MNYAIFKSKPVMTTHGLAQIGVHILHVTLYLDKRTNTKRWNISKKQYIRNKIHLSELQDLYYKSLFPNVLIFHLKMQYF